MKFRLGDRSRIVCSGALALALLSACVPAPPRPPTADTAAPAIEGRHASDVIVYASDLSAAALSELDFMADPASPDGKSIGLPNTGDELDPPPENDPHVIFPAAVQQGVPYRCWIHMKVGQPKGRSTANIVWVQFSDSVDPNGQAVFRPGSGSYLTAQGPARPGWTWVSCRAGAEEALVSFGSTGDVTIRIQAGAEGVSFDQFVLSPESYLHSSPPEAIVVK